MTENTRIGDITAELRASADISFLDFNAKLVPNIDKRTMVGIRVPKLREYAKLLGLRCNSEKLETFLHSLPHTLFEENMLHAIVLGNFAATENEAFALLEEFLPFIDNWAVCDVIRIKAFASQHADTPAILRKLTQWSESSHTYTIRFAVVTLLNAFLDAPRYEPSQLNVVANIHSDDYYVNMARAWYFATALAKQWDTTIEIFLPQAPTNERLDDWTHNKSIQKARESFRITAEQKTYLQSLKR